MIDFHSHILPQIDDGSENVEQSLDMLRLLANQNIDAVVATPHFYLEREPIESFLARRDAAFQELNQSISDDEEFPRVLLAAEVRFFDGISHYYEIDKLRIGNSSCLLLEMPFSKWNQRIFNEVYSLSSANSINIIIAHVERYLRYKNEKRSFYDLIEMGAILQINTCSFIDRGSRRPSLDLLKIGNYFVLGTDCHNMTDRIPDFDAACEVITAKLGFDQLRQIDALSQSLLMDS